jgi:hypothetical protein
MAGFLNWFNRSREQKNKEDHKDDTFKAGQAWHYHTRPGEEHSVVTVLKVEKYESEGIVVHVQVKGLKVKNPMNPAGFSDEIGHLPFAKEAVGKSVTTLISEGNTLPDFMGGYSSWKEAFDAKKGGIFTISVGEAVKYLEEAMSNAQRVE